MYLDLDDFKHINDGLGHQYGDVLLKAISHSFQRIKGIESTCYRMGGDEFVIIVPMQHYHRLEEILLQIEGIFSKPWFLKGADYYCTMSMGIVAFPDDGETVEDLIKKADIAMYEAKHRGKNQIARYSQESGSIANKRLDMEKNMRAATSSKEGYREFEIYYQPLVDVTKSGYPCVGAEALIRWNNAQLGFISPVDFIPLAEYLGLINPIGDYVLRKACEAGK
jgi:diguanylate cyclase (GGDEF)-like protein